ncbi:MAG: NAD-dependent epimerase/dehydratase family protein [Acidimicrobiales bacterium]|nr:NAD-dependent epimerase/dehydratase family protein [Acidimicrobiales bacterium]
MSLKVLVTGSAGLIGSEAVTFFDRMGAKVDGVDNNMRADFFGPQGDVTWNRQRLEATCTNYTHHTLDIRDRSEVDSLIARLAPEVIIHTAAQPSHDLAASRPFDDFDVNAGGTLALLEATRLHAPDAVFIHMSTNKVYGDNPNRIPLVELDTRFDYDPDARVVGLTGEGITEELSLDHTTHSLFGVSKVSSDLMVQEYGRYFGMNTAAFRGGCLTGPHHSGVELHGFLSYLVTQALAEGDYTMIGHKGKQVRDQLHSHDVVSAFWAFAQQPRQGEAYNLGGGRHNAASNLECVELIAQASGGKRPKLSFRDEARIGDHIVYYTDQAKFRSHYPDWTQDYSLDAIIDQMVHAVRRA